MPITINGSGTVAGISAGGLPDASIVTADIADANITADKLSGAQTGSAPIYGCRAWVNFDGLGTIGANATIRASGNVSTVLKNAAGAYTVNFATPMPDANYCVVVTANSDLPTVGSKRHAMFNSLATGSVKVLIGQGDDNVALSDRETVSVAIFR